MIREAQSKDSKAIFPLAKLMATSFEVRNPEFSESFREVMNKEDAVCLVAEVEGKIVAYLIGFDHVAFYANGRVSWVEEIYTLEEYRKKGIGRELMLKFEEWSLKRGAKLVALATRRAADFYESLGYTDSAAYYKKPLPFAQQVGADDVEQLKPLTTPDL